MAKRYDKFTAPYADSHIPFLVVEVLTNGAGEMVDLVCRWANGPAAACLNTTPQALLGRRFCRSCPPERLEQLRPMASVAFSGPPVSLPYETVQGRPLTAIFYQLFYGVCGCILEDRTPVAVPAPSGAELLVEQLPGGTAVLELGRSGIRTLSMNQRLCQLTGYSQREFLRLFAEDFARLIHPEDRTDLLQSLLDGSRTGQPAAQELRIVQKDGGARWVSLRAVQLPGRSTPTFYALLLDIDEQRRTAAAVQESQAAVQELQWQLSGFFDAMPEACGLFFLPTGGTLRPLQLSRGLAELLGLSAEQLRAGLEQDPGQYISDREGSRLRSWAKNSSDGSLRHTCHIRIADGASRTVDLSAEKREQPDGVLLIVTLRDSGSHQPPKH